MTSTWRKTRTLWAAWMRLARTIGNLQARVLLTVLYAIVFLPFGVCVRLFADPLRTKRRPANWLDTPERPVDMHWAQKQ
jgi:hypothetical protein